MPDQDDHELLAEFVRSGSEDAFATLVTRYVNLVYSTALRFSGNPHSAEEITQAVFIVLARKAGGLRRATVLSGWLYQTARLTSANFVKGEIRRQNREQEAYMQTALNETSAASWEHIAPLLDEAMGGLGQADRDAMVLRFFENKTAREIAAVLKVDEAAAYKRLNRALEKLRKFFTKRGITLSATALAGTVAANSVQAAPAGLATTATVAALKGGTISVTLTTLVKGTMKTMTWLKFKSAIGTAVALLIAGGAATVAISQTTGGDGPTPQKIIQKSQAAYAALTSYSDDGTEAGTIGTTTVPPHTFSIKLARPNLYKIDWVQDMGFFAQTGGVWSAGNGDFVKITLPSKPQKYPNMQGALSTAMGISGGASDTAPMAFFNLRSGRLAALLSAPTRKPDEKVGDVDCYVLTQTKGGRTQTLWIGKSDFLIHQCENDTSAAVLKALLDTEARNNPQMKIPVTPTGDVKSVETHQNIVLNPALTPADFTP